MILGRSTPQWVSLITSAGGLAQLLIVQFVPGIDPVAVATIIGAIVVFLGGFLAFLANTATTPTDTPKLEVGKPITVTDAEGAVIGHAPVPTPETPTNEDPARPIG